MVKLFDAVHSSAPFP